MRIKATDAKAVEVDAVFVDGKRVMYPIEFDTEEGWCTATMPLTPNAAVVQDDVNPDTDDPEAAATAEWIEVRLEGLVQVAWKGSPCGSCEHKDKCDG